jgi:hypothetical protein
MASQCFLLKSLNEPLGGAGSGLWGEALSQIIFERPFSIGDIMIASKKMKKNATENITNMPTEARIASNMIGMTASRGFF